MGTQFELRFPTGEINSLALEYDYGNELDEELELAIISTVGPRAKKDGYLAFDDFLKICRWKTKRTGKRCETNLPEFVKAVTSTSFSTQSDQLRIEVLKLLAGVGWPTASVILHFCSDQRYPILDFRALWSVGVEVPNVYGFKFWREYTDFCRRTAQDAQVDMRTLDRALWKYSQKHQSPRS